MTKIALKTIIIHLSLGNVTQLRRLTQSYKDKKLYFVRFKGIILGKKTENNLQEIQIKTKK